MRSKLLVVQVNDLLHLLVDLGQRYELRVVAIVQVVFQSPVVQRVEVGRYDGGGNLLMLSHDHHLVNVLRLAQLVLKYLRSHVFACRQFENILLAVGNLQVAASHHLADVARVEPAVAVYHLCCVFGVFVVAHHHVRSAGQNLAVLGNHHLGAAQGGAYGAETHQVVDRVVDGDNRRSLAEAVAFIYVHSGGAEEAHQAFGNAAASADDDHTAAAEFLAPVAVDHTVVEAVHQLVPDGHLLDDAVVVAHTVLERAEVDGLLDGGKVLAGGIELVVEHLEHAWHGAESAAFDVLHIALQGAHTLGIVNAAS